MTEGGSVVIAAFTSELSTPFFSGNSAWLSWAASSVFSARVLGESFLSDVTSLAAIEVATPSWIIAGSIVNSPCFASPVEPVGWESSD